jgi:hypothetical protein
MQVERCFRGAGQKKGKKTCASATDDAESFFFIERESRGLLRAIL